MQSAELADQQKIATVQRMFDAWEGKQWQSVVELFTVDGIFHSVMLEPVVGREAILARLLKLRVAEPDSVLNMHVKHIGVIDGLVFAERFDRWVFGGVEGGIPVVGIFEFHGDRIARWREIYDRASLRREAGYDASRE